MAFVKISRAILYAYELPLKRELVLYGESYLSREGLLLELQTDTGDEAWGDICPLPWFSQEKLIHSEEMARRELRELVGRDIDDIRQKFVPPSLAFGVETAILQLRTRKNGVLPAELLSPGCRRRISVNGLLTGDDESIFCRARDLVEAGFRSLKLKVGRRTVDEDTRLVKELRRIVGDSVSLRLDGNHLMPPDSYEQFARAVVTENIEYIEEPTNDPDTFYGAHPKLEQILPVAIDELLSLTRPDNLKNLVGGAAAIVVKPTILGFDKAHRFCEVAKRLSIPATISAAFCSAVGLLPHVWLAAAVNDRDIASGFDSANWFADDLLKPGVDMSNGYIDLARLPDPETCLDRTLLMEIDRA